MNTGNGSVGMNGSGDSSATGILRTVTTLFEQAQTECSEIAPRDPRYVVSLCAVCLPIAKTYCRATACLLDSGFRLPAQALLHIMAEIFVKVLWCVSAENEDEIKARELRWERSTGREKLRVLRQLLKTPQLLDDNQLAQLRKMKNAIEQAMQQNPQTDCMPPVTGDGGLFALTSHLFSGNNMSAFLYGQFCSAVHVDTSVLRGSSKM